MYSGDLSVILFFAGSTITLESCVCFCSCADMSVCAFPTDLDLNTSIAQEKKMIVAFNILLK